MTLCGVGFSMLIIPETLNLEQLLTKKIYLLLWENKEKRKYAIFFAVCWIVCTCAFDRVDESSESFNYSLLSSKTTSPLPLLVGGGGDNDSDPPSLSFLTEKTMLCGGGRAASESEKEGETSTSTWHTFKLQCNLLV